MLLLPLCAALLLAPACVPQSGEQSPAEAASGATGSGADRPLEDFQGQLLDLAFQAATALPVNPHIKNRSRAQEAVVAACLELDQPRRALACIEKIDNWRRGSGYADLASFWAQRGDVTEARRCLDLARQVADGVHGETAQDWHKDRILAKIAATQLQMGLAQDAADLEAGLVASESGRVAAARALLLDDGAFDAHLAMLDQVLAAGSFDQTRGALESCAALFRRFYQDQERRSQVEERIRVPRAGLPLLVRIELLMQLAESALEHEDRAKALELVHDAQLLVESVEWIPEDRIALMARLAGLRHRSGDAEGARSRADAALALFDAQRDRIADIYRAGALRPLAEAYQSMGDSAAALAVYRRAVADGAGNPNSRPRAEDLAATCCSMAVHAVEPDAELRTRMRRIHAELSHPW
ncbi:MAG: hypothetical protein EYC70_07470 [Planctomycetota bacterium]|nr:MAG: hypothetical protein EYC70_07470 [Planctomycetota bacterium]